MNAIKCIIPTSIPAIGVYAENVGPNYTWTQAHEDCANECPAYSEELRKHHDLVERAEQMVKSILEMSMPFSIYTSIEVENAKYQLIGITYKMEDQKLLCVFHFTQF